MILYEEQADFCNQVAESCGFRELDDDQIKAALSSRDSARKSFRSLGPTTPPMSNYAGQMAWLITQKHMPMKCNMAEVQAI